MFGEVTNPKNRELPDMTWRERWTLIPLVVLAIWIGVYPWSFFSILEAPVERLVQQQIVPVLRAEGAAVELPPLEGPEADAAAVPPEPGERGARAAAP
jgi:hypothetical protein